MPVPGKQFQTVCTIIFPKGKLIMMFFKRFLALVLTLSMTSLSMGNVHAAMVSNDQIMHQTQQANAKAVLLQSLQREDVQVQLAELGVSAADIETRIAQMTPEEITQLNQQMNELPAGAGVLGFVLIIFIIFVITDVIGATDIFPFIHPVR